MSEFAMQVLDKAKAKADRAGLKKGMSRLTEDDAPSDAGGLPFPAASASRDNRKLTLPQVMGAIVVTALLAALVSALFTGGGEAQRPRLPQSGSTAAGGGRPAPGASADGDAAAGHGNNDTSVSAPPGAEAAAALVDMVDSQKIRAHLESLYSIAMGHDGNRAMGTDGYTASVQYVRSTLSTLAGLRVTVHDFTVSKNQLDASSPATLSIPSTSAIKDSDFSTMSNTGFGNVTGVLIPAGFGSDGASAGSQNGCNANGTTDFGAVAAAAQAGRTVVALVERGSCFFSDKMKNAQAAGATAMLIYNANNGPVFSGTLGSSGDVAAYLPSLGLSSSLGRSLLDRYAECPWPASAHAPTCEPLEVRVFIAGRFETIESQNVIAETETGDDTSIVVVGAHLDGVEAGTCRACHAPR